MSIRRFAPMALLALVAGASSLLLSHASAQAEKPSEKPAEFARIHFETTIKAGAEEVWRAWTTSEGMTEALGPKTNIELAIGGPYEILFHPDAPEGEQGSEGCRVLSYLPNEMLSFSWNAPVKFAHARQQRTWVVVRFDEVEGGVRVRLTHLGWDEMKAAHPKHAKEWDEVREFFTPAWGYVATTIKQSLEKKSREK